MAEKADLPPYPLAQVQEVKRKRVEDAEKVVKEKKKALETEQEKLKAREKERDKVKEHHKAKVQQLREEFTHGTTSNKIDQMKIYIKVVLERLTVEEKKVKEQKTQVELAEKNLDIAKAQLKAREKEEDKIKTHREYWEKEMLKELEIQEGRLEDDIGSTMFLTKYSQKRREKE